MVAKLSHRHLIDLPRWLQDGAKALLADGAAVSSQDCYDNGSRLYLRSEACLLDIRQWWETGAWKEFVGRKSLAPCAELHYWHLIVTHLGGRIHPWTILSSTRNKQMPGIIWHCANSERDYHDLAARFGLTLDPDFHNDGSQTRKGFGKSYRTG